MTIQPKLWPAASLLLLIPTLVSSAEQKDYPIVPVPFNEVELEDAFWKPRLVIQRETLVPFALEQTKVGVAHLQAAADHLAGKDVQDHRPHRFVDSDLYKVMEGAAYMLRLQRDQQLEAQLDEIIAVIAAAQEPDGYLYPSHTTGAGSSEHMMGDAPYSYVVHSHELYNMGHLYEAAVAYYQATGKDNLLQIAEKSAQHINRVIFEGDPRYNGGKPVMQAPGHEEIELALIRLYRTTGNPLYLNMASRFLEIRGRTYRPDGEEVMAPTYAQQHAPVEMQREAVGHAVRAAYLYSAMADVAALTGNKAYTRALDSIWHDIVDTRMHIIGGLGAIRGIEGFGPQYDLPNKEAYDETCAAVGNVLFNYRMFLLHGDAKYLDVAEVALLNNVLAGVNFEGNRFFYVNPLESDGEHPFNQGTASRAPWFDCACCPANMARLVPQIPGMMYAHDDDNLWLTFYAGGETTISMKGSTVEVEQETDYPYGGTIRLKVHPENPVTFSLRLRVPTWAGSQFLPGKLYSYTGKSPAGKVQLSVNGKSQPVTMQKGFAVIQREWKAGDRVELSLPMHVRFNECHPRVEANRGRIALTRGPLVLCAESVDNDGPVQRFALEKFPSEQEINLTQEHVDDGISLLTVTLPATERTEEGTTGATLNLVPYFAWNNRGTGSMLVWFPAELNPDELTGKP